MQVSEPGAPPTAPVGRSRFCGGNDAGKSILLHTISGLIKTTAGRISFEGRDIHNEPPENIVTRGIVQVPEGRRLFALMSVKDNLLVGA